MHAATLTTAPLPCASAPAAAPAAGVQMLSAMGGGLLWSDRPGP